MFRCKSNINLHDKVDCKIDYVVEKLNIMKKRTRFRVLVNSGIDFLGSYIGLANLHNYFVFAIRTFDNRIFNNLTLDNDCAATRTTSEFLLGLYLVQYEIIAFP